ncbi:MAG: sigma-54-dependent Fis family transcriptional regulator, partial [Deltaproteobacteria bacterium]|nr:sigma-54-dependent Fis family transcriptional regulator [Deltaproteobacteria bacterium]
GLDSTIPVVMISGHATVEMSIQALRRGAYDMLVKPFEPEELLRRLRNALRQTELLEENRELKDELAARFGAIVGSSPALLPVLETARKVAVRDIPVLITGESGTGKELLAQAVHQHSARRGERFVAINCGAIPEALLESELFGHRRGAFTGADRDHDGLVTAADRGTLFLDEIGTLPHNVQTALLRFLQGQEFYRVGDTTPRKVDVRIVSATNRDMEAAIDEGELREDLYYRLAVVRLRMPALRERRDDIPVLAAHFLRQGNERFGTALQGFTPDAMRRLCEHDWPGNVRQLSNVIQAASALEGGERIGVDTLAQVLDLGRGVPPAAGAGAGNYHDALSRFETDYLRRLLEESGGVVETAADAAGMNPATIYRKLKKYGLR